MHGARKASDASHGFHEKNLNANGRANEGRNYFSILFVISAIVRRYSRASVSAKKSRVAIALTNLFAFLMFLLYRRNLFAIFVVVSRVD